MAFEESESEFPIRLRRQNSILINTSTCQILHPSLLFFLKKIHYVNKFKNDYYQAYNSLNQIYTNIKKN